VPQGELVSDPDNAAEQLSEAAAAHATIPNGVQRDGEAAIDADCGNVSDNASIADAAPEASEMPLPPSSPSDGLGCPVTPFPDSPSMLPAMLPLPPSPMLSVGSEAGSVAEEQVSPSPAMSRPISRLSAEEALDSPPSPDAAEALGTPSEADSGDEADLDSDDGQPPEQRALAVHFERTGAIIEELASGDGSRAEQQHTAYDEAIEEGQIYAEAARLQAASRGLFSALYQQGLRTAELPSQTFVGAFCFDLTTRHGDAEFTGLDVDLAEHSLHEAFEHDTESEQSQSSQDERDDDSSSEADFRLPRGISTSTIAHTTPGGSPESTRGRKRGSKLLTGGEVPLEAAGEDGGSAGHVTPDESQTSSSETIEGDSTSDSDDEPLQRRSTAQAAHGAGQVVSASRQADQHAVEQRARYVAEQLNASLDRTLVRRTGSVHEEGGGPLQLFGSRWRSGKLREKIHSNRPDPENLVRNDARNSDGQLINPTVLNEVAPLRLHSGGEHKYL
jgi:hypothetical protein